MADEDSVDTTYSTEDIRWLEDSLANTKPSTEDIRWLEDSLANTKPSTEDIRWLEDCLAGTKISTEEIRLPLEGSLLDSVFMPESSSSQPSKDRDSVHKKLCAGSQETNLPRKLIIQKRRDLVLFGEANHTHAIAIAAMRGGSWERITVTYLNENLCELLPRGTYLRLVDRNAEKEFFAWAVLKAIDYTERNLPITNPFEETLEKVRKLCQLEPPPNTNWKHGVDATDTGDLDVKGKVVWFQSPYVSGGTGKLVKAFLDHMATKKAEYVLIGITTHDDYICKYGLIENEILKLEHGQLQSLQAQYEFVVADKSLINDLLLHGYCHKWCSKHNDDIHDHHLTLVFKLKK
jgi:hypothetical protein